MTDSANFRQVFANRNFKILWVNQILMQVSIGTLNFSIILLIRQLTGSNVLTSLFVLTVILPTVLFAVIAGVLADITDRRKIILTSELLLAISALPYLLVSSHVYLLLLVSLVFNSIAQFFIPSERATIPMVVEKPKLLVANSLFSFTLYGSQFVGFSIAGPLVLKFGYDSVFLGVSVTLLIALFLARLLPSLKPTSKQLSVVTTIRLQTITRFKEGLLFVLGHQPLIAGIIVLAGLQGIVGTLAALSPGYLEDTLKIRAAEASFSYILPLGLGAVIGSLSVGRFGGLFSRRGLIAYGALGSGLLLVLLGFLPQIIVGLTGSEFLAGPIRSVINASVIPLTFIVSLIWLALGFFAMAVLIPAQTVLQENTPISIQGRVFSTLAIFVSFMSVIPIVLSGGLADIFGISAVFLFSGVLVIMAATIIFLIPNIRRMILPWLR